MSFASVFTRLDPQPAIDWLAQRASEGRGLLALGVLGALACAAPGGLSAQTPGAQDETFVSGASGSTFYAIADEVIDDQELFVVGGDLSELDRLDTDGSLDVNFKFADIGNIDRIVYTVVPQVLPNDLDRDKTLIGGLFGETPPLTSGGKATPAQNVQRLNSDGLPDPSFNPGYGANNYVTSLLPESNGSIYVGGLFDHFNHFTHYHVLRLNVDGSIDGTFSSSLNILDAVLSMADQIDAGTGLPNGQIIIAGTFNRVDQTNSQKLARLNNDGSLDKTFHPVIGTRVLSVVCQPDGKILLGGSFTSVNGQGVQNIARLNQDGSLDTTFNATVTTNPPASPDPTAVYILKLLSDGRIYVGGNFYTVDGVRREYLARLLPDGKLDTTFDPGSAVINSVQSLAVQSNNDLLVGETVSRKINNIFPPSLIRLYSDNPALPDVVTITASKPSAVEKNAGGGTTKGQFSFVRTGDLSQGLTVSVTAGGTAVSGVGYKPLKLGGDFKKTFLPGVSTVAVNVRPTGTTLSHSPETVTLTLQPSDIGNYTLGNQTSATVTLSNH